MVPPAFPLLLICPALLIDLFLWKFGKQVHEHQPQTRLLFNPGWWKDWLLAMGCAVIFVGIALAVQWNFSEFLLSDAAANRFFARDGHWPYFSKPGTWMNTFWDLEKYPVTWKSIAWACLIAFVSCRFGLWIGNYLLRLRR
jgi:hypothetical protein